MSLAQLAPSMTNGSSRWLLLGSLALNLFFIAFAVALAVRPPAPPSAWDRDVFVRVERIADTLPAADAAILRARIKTDRSIIEDAQEKYRSAQDVIRTAMRAEPWDAEALRTAMTDTRTARQAFDQIIQGAFAGAAAQMSPPGRQALANWPLGRKSAGAKQ
jgi:uncharacterized membrane protein